MATFNWPPSLNGTTGANQSLSNLTGPTAVNVPLYLPNGSAAAPSLSFTNDTGIGIYRSASGELSIARNGVINTAFTGNNFGGQSFLMPQELSLICVVPGVTSTLPSFANTFTAASDEFQSGVAVMTPQSVSGGPVYDFYSSNGTIASPSITTASVGGNTMGYLAWHGHNGTAYEFCGGVYGIAPQNWGASSFDFALGFSITPHGGTVPVTTLTLNQDFSASFAGDVDTGGYVLITTAGKGIGIKSGANCTMGTAVLVGGTVTVSSGIANTGWLLFVSRSTVGGTPGHLSTTQTGGSFTINSSSGADTSTVNWLFIFPL